MVSAIMALLSFILGFTFNGAAGRHDARENLVIEEANAIGTTWMRAGFLDEPCRTTIRGLLLNYVSVRVKAATGKMDVEEAARQSEAVHDKMWALAEEAGKKDAGSVAGGLFIHSLNEVIDLHLKRVTVGMRNRIAPTIWATLYLLLVLGMYMMGTQAGLSGSRHLGMELALAVSFSVVLLVTADLDRSQEGTINASQQAMEELQTRLNAR